MAPRTKKKTAPASVIRRATLTEQAIKQQLESDGGNAFRHYLGYYMRQASDPFRQETGPRGHLGASRIGGLCDRELWYGFHWASEVQLDARLIRLFNRGHLEEPRFLALLSAIGCEVYNTDNTTGEQYSIVGYGGHYSGSLDAVIRGCPDIPNEPILGEFKTANAKSFARLLEKGVQLWKEEYYGQALQYMGAYGLNYALFMVANKDDDELYCELIAADPEQAAKDYARAGDIIFREGLPPRIDDSPTFWKCEYCSHNPICHEPERNPVAVNCRTCGYCGPTQEGGWTCDNPARQVEVMGREVSFLLDYDAQRKACSHYQPYTLWIKD